MDIYQHQNKFIARILYQRSVLATGRKKELLEEAARIHERLEQIDLELKRIIRSKNNNFEVSGN